MTFVSSHGTGQSESVLRILGMWSHSCTERVTAEYVLPIKLARLYYVALPVWFDNIGAWIITGV